MTLAVTSDPYYLSLAVGIICMMVGAAIWGASRPGR